MKIKIETELTPEEFKELFTPGPKQTEVYTELCSSLQKSMLESMGEFQKNVWNWQTKK